MVWSTLGTVTLNDWDWKTFDIPIIEGEVFKVTHNYVTRPIGHATICSVFSDGSRYGFKKVYATQEPTVFLLEIPQQLIEAGLTVRYISIRLATYSRIYATTNWQVTLEHFDPP